MSLLQSLQSLDFKKIFINSFYEKGYAYYRAGKVKQLEIRRYNRRGDESIVAQVSGEQTKTYSVEIRVESRQHKVFLVGMCSCPVVVNCKHVVAVLLAALNKEKPEWQRDPQVDRWLQDINHSLITNPQSNNQIDESHCLIYLLSTLNNNHATMQLQLCLVKRLAKGGLGTPRDFSVTTDSHQRHLYPIDKELLIKLEVAKKLSGFVNYYHRAFPLKGEMIEKLVPEILATNRCYWVIPNDSPLQLGDTCQADVFWQMDENGFQQLRHSMMDKESFYTFSIDRLWYLDKKNHTLGLMETGLDKNVAKLLLSAPKIPPEQIQEVSGFLAKYQQLTVIAPPKKITLVKSKKIKPTPRLRLFQTSIRVPGDYKTNWQAHDLIKPVATLSFDYQNIEIPWQDQRPFISKMENDQLTRIVRDKEFEENILDELFLEGDLTSFQEEAELENLNANIRYHFLVGHNELTPLDFTATVLPVLRAKGWQIEIAEDYPYQIMDDPIDDWYSTIEEGSGYDWFSLELGITIKGEKINLLPILQKLLPTLRDNKQLDESSLQPIFAQLPNGHFIQLPAERVKNILDVLVELYDKEALTEDKMLRLSKLHALRLLELEAALGAATLRWLGGDNLRKFATKLAQFKQITPVEQPQTFKGQLRPYQLEGLSWLQFLREYECGGILADDMGLGKTVQALCHILIEHGSGRMQKPCLVIAPTSLMFNWRMEAERFAPSLRVLVLHGAERKNYFADVAQYNLVLTTYPLLVRDKEILLQHDFHLLILDEAQFIKNSKSLATQIVQQIKAQHRLCLTGTPLENHLGELWSLFNFMMPGLLGDLQSFNHLFRTPIEKQRDEERHQHLVRRINPFLLRRTKDKVVKELPEKVNMIRQVELDGAQLDLYETIRITMQEKVRKEIAKLGLARSHIIILDALLKLRQVCCDPRLLKISTPKKTKAKSAKLELLIELLTELLAEGRRILLFSQFTEMLELIEIELKRQNLSYVKLTGQTKDRATPVQQFQAGEVPLFLISLKAGGTGLNLTAADTVIHYDPWWNPAVENQATDRAHRIGQHKTVFVYKFVTKGTVEEKILEMQQHKHALMEGLFSATTTGKLKLSDKDIQGLFDPLVT